MRQTLFRIALDTPWIGWTEFPNQYPVLGACWVWIALYTAFLLWHLLSGRTNEVKQLAFWIQGGVGLLIISLLHKLPVIPSTVPVFGYGAMVLLGVTGAIAFTIWRAKAIRVHPDLIYDSAFWIVISGVIGGRLAFLIQYRNSVYPPGISLPEALFRTINLSEGGLVLIGALVGGGIGMAAYFYVKKLSVLEFADLLIPGVFIGVGFGRIGCLLNGCCFGDRCDLPWGISFPIGTTTYDVIASRGFLAENALATMPLHPTQIYSSIDGFLLAFVTAVFYWYRKHAGDGLALGCLLYSITRFFIEFLRSDEMGQGPMGLTISQKYSIGIFALGLALLLTGKFRSPAGKSLPRTLPLDPPNSPQSVPAKN